MNRGASGAVSQPGPGQADGPEALAAGAFVARLRVRSVEISVTGPRRAVRQAVKAVAEMLGGGR